MISSLEKKGELQGYAFNGFFLNVIKKQLRYKEMLLKLENWDFEILLFLVEKYPNPAKNEEIRAIFPRNTSAIKAKQLTEKSISRIRKQIAFIRKNYKENQEQLKHLVIETIKDKGYCLHADVEKIYVETTKTETEIKDKIIPIENPQSQESPQTSSIWKIMPYVLLICVLGLLVGLYYYWEKEAILLTNYKVTRADVTLNLNNGGWRDLTESEAKSEEPLSKAITQIDLKVEKQYENDGDFEIRLGNTQGPKPELDNFYNLPMRNGGKPEDIKERFSFLQLKSYNSYKFSFEDKKVNVPFQFSYKVNNFNAHNKKPTEFHSQVIYYRTENLTIRIIFPEGKPFKPNEVIYEKKEFGDLNSFQKQNPPKLNSPDPNIDEYVIAHPSGRELIWYIKKPDYGFIYSIEWNW